MYIKRIKGRLYIYESRRVSGKVVPTYVCSATPALAELLKAEQAESAQRACEERMRRQHEEDQERLVHDLFRDVKAQLNITLQAAGYHNPRGRGWRRRRGGQGDRA